MSEARNVTADPRTYLGDAVYASFDGYHIELRTGDGNNQVIYLDPDVYDALVRYVTGVRENAAEAAYERQQEEGFRGGEAAAYEAEQQDRIRREFK